MRQTNKQIKNKQETVKQCARILTRKTIKIKQRVIPGKLNVNNGELWMQKLKYQLPNEEDLNSQAMIQSGFNLYIKDKLTWFSI